MAFFRVISSHNTFKATIRVYSHDIGATITATGGGKSFTATVGSNNIAEVKVTKAATYTITSSKTSRQTTVAVTEKTTYTAKYSWGQYNLKTMYSQQVGGKQTRTVTQDAPSAPFPQFTSYNGSGMSFSLDPNTGIFTRSGGSSSLWAPDSGTDVSSGLPYAIPLNGSAVLHGDTWEGKRFLRMNDAFRVTWAKTSAGHNITFTNAYLYYSQAYDAKGTFRQNITDNYPDTYSTAAAGAKSGNYWYVPI